MFTIVWQRNLGGPARWHAYLTCIHCHLGIAAIIEGKSGTTIGHQGPQPYAGDIEQEFIVVSVWPKVRTLVAPAHTPEPVGRRFIEGEDAFHRRRWNSAVAMYRSALDIATKGMPGVPEGAKFFGRLKWMFDNGRITADIREWADQVRVEGNSALHDPEEFQEADAVSLRYFTEMFLRYVFELPGNVAEFRDRK